MKQNLFIFSDVQIVRKQNTLFFNKVVQDEDDEEELNFLKEDYLFEKEIIIPAGDKKYMPVENIESITVLGTSHFNSRLIYFLSQNSIPLYIMSRKGNLLGIFLPINGKSGTSLVAQASAYDDEEKRVFISSKIVDATAHNTLQNLNYYKNRGRNLAETIQIIEELRGEIPYAETVEELFGIEGYIKRNYYESWREIFNYPVNFFTRKKNPPTDFINSMISFGNAILYTVVVNQIIQVKLYPEIGFMHTLGENKLSLAYDIADIFKPLIVDRTIFKIVNKNILSEKDFFFKNGICMMKKETKKIFVSELEKKILTKMKIKNFNKRVTYKRVVRESLYSLKNFLIEGEEIEFFKSEW